MIDRLPEGIFRDWIAPRLDLDDLAALARASAGLRRAVADAPARAARLGTAGLGLLLRGGVAGALRAEVDVDAPGAGELLRALASARVPPRSLVLCGRPRSLAAAADAPGLGRDALELELRVSPPEVPGIELARIARAFPRLAALAIVDVDPADRATVPRGGGWEGLAGSALPAPPPTLARLRLRNVALRQVRALPIVYPGLREFELEAGFLDGDALRALALLDRLEVLRLGRRIPGAEAREILEAVLRGPAGRSLRRAELAARVDLDASLSEALRLAPRLQHVSKLEINVAAAIPPPPPLEIADLRLAEFPLAAPAPDPARAERLLEFFRASRVRRVEVWTDRDVCEIARAVGPGLGPGGWNRLLRIPARAAPEEAAAVPPRALALAEPLEYRCADARGDAEAIAAAYAAWGGRCRILLVGRAAPATLAELRRRIDVGEGAVEAAPPPPPPRPRRAFH